MAYSETEENEHHKKGWIITIIVHAILLLWFFFSSMAIPEKIEDKITGIIVNFGDAEAGKKTSNPKTSNVQPKPQKPQPEASSSASSAASEPIIDQKIEEVKAENAISLSTEKKKKKEKAKKEDKKATENDKKKKDKKEDKTKVSETKAEEAPEAKEKEQELDNRALFTKKKNDNKDNKPSQGTSERDLFKDQGKNTDYTANQDSDEYGDPYSSELSSNGITANLRGRVLKYIPEVKKRFQTNGKVVIKIKVDQSGKVIQVDQDISKSTTNDPSLVKIALDTAQKAMFNQDFSASVRQSGSITFEFKVQ